MKPIKAKICHTSYGWQVTFQFQGEKWVIPVDWKEAKVQANKI